MPKSDPIAGSCGLWVWICLAVRLWRFPNETVEVYKVDRYCTIPIPRLSICPTSIDKWSSPSGFASSRLQGSRVPVPVRFLGSANKRRTTPRPRDSNLTVIAIGNSISRMSILLVKWLYLKIGYPGIPKSTCFRPPFPSKWPHDQGTTKTERGDQVQKVHVDTLIPCWFKQVSWNISSSLWSWLLHSGDSS